MKHPMLGKISNIGQAEMADLDLVALQWSLLSLGGKVKEEHISLLISAGLLVSIYLSLHLFDKSKQSGLISNPSYEKRLGFSVLKLV